MSLLLLSGCLDPSQHFGDASAALIVAGHRVFETHGYALGTVNFVLLEIYGDQEQASRLSRDRVTNQPGSISIHVGDHKIDNIRGSKKLYIIRENGLQVFDLACSEADVSDVLGAVSRFNDVDGFVDFAIARLTVKPATTHEP